MEIQDICADLVTKANALKALTTVFSDTFTSGSADDMARNVAIQPDTFSYLAYVIFDYVCQIMEIAENLDSEIFQRETKATAEAEE